MPDPIDKIMAEDAALQREIDRMKELNAMSVRLAFDEGYKLGFMAMGSADLEAAWLKSKARERYKNA